MTRHLHGIPMRLCAVLALVLGLTAGDAANAETLVRPGTFFQTDAGVSCTLGFLFERVFPEGEPPKGPELYAATAGHCVLDGRGQASWPVGAGPSATVGGQLIGHFVFAADERSDESGLDIAILKLAVPQESVDPSVCFFGGPTGLDVDRRLREGEELSFVGNSNTVLRPRHASATNLAEPRIYFLGPTLNGDSGGPILSADGSALALVSAHHVSTERVGSNAAGSRISVQLPQAEQVLGFQLDLLSAPLEPVSWPLDAVTPTPVPC